MSPQAASLVVLLLHTDPTQRLSAAEAKAHPWCMALGEGNFSHVQFLKSSTTDVASGVSRDEIVTRDEVLWVAGAVGGLPGIHVTPLYRDSPRSTPPPAPQSAATKSTTPPQGSVVTQKSRSTGNAQTKVLQDVSTLPKNNIEQQRLKELEALRDCVVANEDEIKVLTPQGEST